jgi:hypothetical protein
MQRRDRYRCERVRKNNGIIEVFFTRHDLVQEEYVLVNIVADPDEYEVRKPYWITIEPAFPH